MKTIIQLEKAEIHLNNAKQLVNEMSGIISCSFQPNEELFGEKRNVGKS